MLTNHEEIGRITLLRLATSRLTSADLPPLQRAHEQMRERGRSAMLVDLAGVRRAARSGLAALTEFAWSFRPGTRVGFFGAGTRLAAELAACPLAAQLPCFATRDQALRDPDFRALRLGGLKAVLLCAGAGSRMAPLSDATPKPMLDFLGRPVLEHLMRHLEGFGIRDFLLNPGHHGEVIHNQFRTDSRRSLFFVNEGRHKGGRWHGAPLGSASTLIRLQSDHCAFDDDFLVLCGDALIDLDLAAMLERHRQSGAEVTIAALQVPRQDVSKYGILECTPEGRVRAFQEKPAPDRALSTLASTGIYIFSPRALSGMPAGPGQDIAGDLLPAILARNGHVAAFTQPFGWVDLGCGRDYFAALTMGIQGRIAGLVPQAVETRPGLWVAPGAQVSRRARISGACYLGPGAVVEAGARIDGPAVICAGALIRNKALVRNSFIAPDTLVGAGAWVDGMLAHADWAVAHRFADGSAQCRDPLTGLGRRPESPDLPATRPTAQPTTRPLPPLPPRPIATELERRAL